MSARGCTVCGRQCDRSGRFPWLCKAHNAAALQLKGKAKTRKAATPR